MKAVVQRVRQSSVSIDGKTVGEIQCGLMVLLGVTDVDTEQECDYLADKIAGLRIDVYKRQQQHRCHQGHETSLPAHWLSPPFSPARACLLPDAG